MNITEVARRVRSGVITDSKEVMRDVALIFANAVQYNGVKTEIGQQAQALWLRFEELVPIPIPFLCLGSEERRGDRRLTWGHLVSQDDGTSLDFRECQ